MRLLSINPSNYQEIGGVDISTPADVENAVRSARKAQKEWQNIGLARRIEILRKAIEVMRGRKSEFVLLESKEMGMPITEADADFVSTLEYANWYFDNAEKYLSPETTFESDTELHQVFREPLGVIAVIIPWNFPFANFVWGALQALIAGNTIVLKHSEECPLNGKFIADVFSQCLPDGVFSELYGDGEVGKALIQQEIDMVTFTGSTKTGKYLYETTGKKFIKAVMELGGSAPGIIFEDADVELAVGNVCNARLANAGQCCDGLKRLIVHESIFDDVVKKAAMIFSAKKIGNAEDKTTEIGPLVAKRQLNLLISQVEDSKEKGAGVVVGGNSLEQELGGAFFEPTVLINVTNEMKIWKDEVFGPVLPVVKFSTEEEAIKLANETTYGLGAYIFTKDTDKAGRVASNIDSGMVGINGTNYIRPFNPFGGYKNSGFGREHGKYGFQEVTKIKLVSRNK